MPPHEPLTPDRRGALIAAVVLAIAGLVTYANSLQVPFVFDDGASIVHNRTIRDLGNLAAVLSPPGDGVTVAGRPILNLSLAINYAIGGLAVRSYHVVNLALHVLAALTLFGILRRTLALMSAREDSARPDHSLSPREVTFLSLAAALLWEVHPLTTEAVTYIIQRAESLMGLCYLVTVYGFIRAAGSTARETAWGWLALSALACAAGLGTKEVMVSAPLIVLAYDVILGRRDLGSALRSRWAYYAVLMGGEAWVILLALRTGNRGGTAGFGIDVVPWAYWQTQFQAVVHYLWLCVVPTPLIFDYGVDWVRDPWDIAPYAALVLVLVGGIVVALRRRWTSGFLGLVVLAILAPTSLVPGNRQTLAEHRMYLPLAAIVSGAVCGAYLSLPAEWRRNQRALLLGTALAVAALLSFLSIRRNAVYATELSLYQDTVRSRPGNPAAHVNLANVLRDSNRLDEAIEEYSQALRLRPSYYQADYDMAIALAGAHRSVEAIEHYTEAIRIHPNYPEAQNNLGILLARTGRDSDAVAHLAEAVRLKPDYVEAHYNLGLSLARTGRIDEAIAQFEATLALNPGFYPAHMTLGYALQLLGRGREAQAHFQQADQLRKTSPAAP